MKNKKVQILITVLACIIAEMLLANYQAISLKLSGLEEVELNMRDAITADSPDAHYDYDTKTLKVEKGKISFEEVGVPMKELCIGVKDGGKSYADMRVSFTDENFARESGVDYNTGLYNIYIGTEKTSYLKISSYGEVGTLVIDFFDGIGSPFVITSVKINAPPPFHFSILRFALLIVISLAVVTGAWKWRLKKSDLTPLLVMNTGIMCLMLILLTMVAQGIHGRELLDAYPLKDEYTMDQYEQLFAAFHEGRLNINVDVDPAELDALDNPLDITERDEVGISGDYWDRAYYNGKFYSYFGVAPVFTVYYPVYFLTGQIPTGFVASTIETVYAIIFISLLYIVVIRELCKDLPMIPVMLGHYAMIFGSALLPMYAEGYFYYIAAISGMGALAAFFYFLIRAYFSKGNKLRIAMLILCGISVVIIAASRPTLLLYCAAAIVPAVFIFTDKDISIKNKVIYCVSLGTPIILGAAGIMIYNYARFGSPMEFGFTYQLTVSNASANGLSLSFIPAAIFHYFIQPPIFKTKFPYVEMNSQSLTSYPRYTYVGWALGALSYPLTWAAGMLPFMIRKNDKFKTAFLTTLLALAGLLAFFDMCKAGVHYRYTADILFPILLVALVVLFDVFGVLKTKRLGLYIPAYIGAVLLMAATITLGYLMIFADENAFFLYDFAEITDMLRSL
ncbi:MAG: hypothetical protein IIZ59_03175 [Clostridia bacterium]|nr:hypothetical protein [Clostridia bacterium]